MKGNKGNKSALFYFSTNSLQSQPLRSSLVPAFGLENETNDGNIPTQFIGLILLYTHHLLIYTVKNNNHYTRSIS